MGGFKEFINGNAIMVGLVLSIVALALAYFMRIGQTAALIAAFGGMAFMWHGRTIHVDTGDDED